MDQPISIPYKFTKASLFVAAEAIELRAKRLSRYPTRRAEVRRLTEFAAALRSTIA